MEGGCLGRRSIKWWARQGSDRCQDRHFSMKIAQFPGHPFHSSVALAARGAVQAERSAAKRLLLEAERRVYDAFAGELLGNGRSTRLGHYSGIGRKDLSSSRAPQSARALPRPPRRQRLPSGRHIKTSCSRNNQLQHGKHQRAAARLKVPPAPQAQNQRLAGLRHCRSSPGPCASGNSADLPAGRPGL